MPRPYNGHGNENPHRDEVMAEIHAHLLEKGPNGWTPLLEKWKGKVGIATLWRWIRSAKRGEVPQSNLAMAQASIMRSAEKHQADLPPNAAEIAHDLPATPSPHYISRTGEKGLEQFDMVVEIRNLYKDAEKLRSYAVVPDDSYDDGERIKNPMAFDKSIARRAQILETAIRAVQEIWDLRTMQMFYEIVIEEIGRADLHTQKRILERLAALNARHGINMNMRV